MSLGKILWVDDEIESLQSQILFLENKGYEVNAITNGFDAIDFIKENYVDVVLMDETMPGITGLETLAKIKEIVEIDFRSQLAHRDRPPELAGRAALDRRVVVFDPRQYSLITAVCRRLENSEEITDEAVEPFAARAGGPDHPKLVGVAADGLFKVACGIEYGVDVGIAVNAEGWKPYWQRRGCDEEVLRHFRRGDRIKMVF